MKTVLYLSLTLDGYLAKGDSSTNYVPKEIWDNFREFGNKIGNIIIGRRTYEMMRSRPTPQGVSHIQIVVVSHDFKAVEGVTIASSPEEALQYLTKKGFTTALVGGGAKIDSSFLSQGLIDEVYLNVEPIMLGRGINLVGDNDVEVHLKLIDLVKLNENLIQLHYEVKKA